MSHRLNYEATALTTRPPRPDFKTSTFFYDLRFEQFLFDAFRAFEGPHIHILQKKNFFCPI